MQNIVLLTIDSLRADHLGCYGYAKNTSPHLDELARESMVFERAFAAGIPTMPSFTTLLSGMHPYRHGITAHSSEQRLSEKIVLLPQLAKQAGYTTIGIDNLVVQSHGRGSWFARGFDFYSGFLYQPFSNQSEQLVDRALNFLDDFHHQPFLLWMHLWDPHTPYGPPPPFDTLHYDQSTCSEEAQRRAQKLNDVKSIAPQYYQSFLDDMKLKVQDDYDYVVAQYDGEISYVDSQIGRVLEHLKTLGVWDNSHVIAMSDHGEAFGEGDVYFDHHGLYDAVTRIALMWHAPDGKRGRNRDLISTEDITPTLADCCGLPSPPLEQWTGKSFAPLLNAASTLSDSSAAQSTCKRDFIVSVESSRQASIALRTEKWKLIVPITHDARGENLANIYGREREAKLLLFDLENDPNETNDVSAQFPKICAQLFNQINDWRADEVAQRGGDDPLLENGLSLAYDDFMKRLLARKLRG